MVLPNGWFGRPYDNRHELTRLAMDANNLIIELDGQFTLTFTGATSACPSPDELLISGFDVLTFSWREYGDSQRSHRQTFAGGTVAFKSLFSIADYQHERSRE